MLNADKDFILIENHFIMNRSKKKSKLCQKLSRSMENLETILENISVCEQTTSKTTVYHLCYLK